MDKNSKLELAKDIAKILAKQQRIAYATDFHAFVDGRKLVLAGVEFKDFPKGPNTRRTDGDVVAHAIVMALSAATNTGDIDDWFPDKGKTGIRASARNKSTKIAPDFGLSTRRSQ